MAICAYVGRPGAGKSYGVVENVILPAFERSRCVVTNIPMITEALDARFDEYRLLNIESPALETEEFWLSIPKGAVVVLDEVWRAFPNGMKQDQIPKERREFLAEHRHMVGEDGYSVEVVLVTQDLKQIAASIRPLIDKLYVAEKLDAAGSASRYRVDIYQGYEVKAAKFIRSVFGRYKPEVYQFYKSHTKSESAVAGIEEKADKRATIWGNKYLLFAVPLAWVGVIWAGTALYRIYSHYQDKPAKVATVAEQPKTAPVPVQPRASVQRPPPPPPPPKVEEPKESTRWRIVGSHSDGAQSLVYMRSVTGARRRVPASKCTHDGVEWSCILAGEMITPWSGRTTLSAMGRAPQLAAEHVSDATRPVAPAQRSARSIESPRGVP